MVIAAMKKEPLKIKAEKQGRQYICSVKLADDREATMVYAPELDFSMVSEFEDGSSVYKHSGNGHFPNLIADIINFFECGKISFDTNETLSVMKLREAAIKATDTLGVWLDI